MNTYQMLNKVFYNPNNELAITTSWAELESTLNTICDHLQIVQMGFEEAEREEPAVSDTYGEVFDYITFMESETNQDHYPHSAIEDELWGGDQFAPDEGGEMVGGLDMASINNLVDEYNKWLEENKPVVNWTTPTGEAEAEYCPNYINDQEDMEDVRREYFELDVCGNAIEWLLRNDDKFINIKTKLSPLFNHILTYHNNQEWLDCEDQANILNLLDWWLWILIDEPEHPGPVVVENYDVYFADDYIVNPQDAPQA